MKFNINYGSATDVGKVKEHNTDAVIEFPITNGHVFVVCDGHDGVEFGGALAAKITTEEIKRYFQNRTYANLANALPNAISYANYCVYNQSLKEHRFNGIGATAAILIVQNDEAYYASAGNSRIYLCKGGEIAQITRDHVENGEVKVLIGKEKNIKFSVCKNPIQIDGDEVFMLCTDGLTDQVSENDIYGIVSNKDMSAEFKTAQLIEKANAAGGKDNTSVQVVDFSTYVKKEPRVSIWKSVAIVSVLLLITVGIFEIYKSKVNNSGSKVQTEAVQSKTETIKAEKPAPEPAVSKAKEPAKVEAETKQPSQKQNEQTTTNQQVDDNEYVVYMHKVEKGQNLYRIGLRYNVPLNMLEELNSNEATRLTIGASLKIPVRAIHIVESGETLSGIALAYNSSEANIKKANQLIEGQPLLAGQKLIIPLPKK